MATYRLTHKREDAKGALVAVKGHMVGGLGIEWDRSTAVSKVESLPPGSVKTARRTATGYVDGSDVHIIVVNGVKYLRTDKNLTAKDNLDELPTF